MGAVPAARTGPLQPAGGRAAPRLAPARPARPGASRAGKSLCVPHPGKAQRLPPAARAAAERGLPLPGDTGFPRGSGAAAAARPYPPLPEGVMGVFIIIINGSSFALRFYYSPIVRGSAQGGQRQSVPGNRQSEQRKAAERAGGKKRHSGRGSIFYPGSSDRPGTENGVSRLPRALSSFGPHSPLVQVE